MTRNSQLGVGQRELNSLLRNGLLTGSPSRSKGQPLHLEEGGPLETASVSACHFKICSFPLSADTFTRHQTQDSGRKGPSSSQLSCFDFSALRNAIDFVT